MFFFDIRVFLAEIGQTRIRCRRVSTVKVAFANGTKFGNDPGPTMLSVLLCGNGIQLKSRMDHICIDPNVRHIADLSLSFENLKQFLRALFKACHRGSRSQL